MYKLCWGQAFSGDAKSGLEKSPISSLLMERGSPAARYFWSSGGGQSMVSDLGEGNSRHCSGHVSVRHSRAQSSSQLAQVTITSQWSMWRGEEGRGHFPRCRLHVTGKPCASPQWAGCEGQAGATWGFLHIERPSLCLAYSNAK